VEGFGHEFDDFGADVHEFIDAGDQVLTSLTFHGRGKQSGVESSWDTWHVWTLRNGSIVHGQGFTSRADALRAAGLSG
jgi:ketosteroid isomerase-like protein